ncbi:MAG: response regulator [Bacteroidales bacterium]
MLKVLVVDDESGIRSGINRILSQFIVGYPFMDEDIGFEIIEAATGEEAIEIFHTNKPDIVLLDNKLPGMDGIQVLDYINKTNLDIEVMMITSYASLELAVKATNIGAYDFVPKPFTPQELRASMENLTKHLFLKRMTRKMNTEGKQIRFQFLTVLSHELKNPLSSIEGYLRMMQGRQAGDTLEAYDEMISRSNLPNTDTSLIAAPGPTPAMSEPTAYGAPRSSHGGVVVGLSGGRASRLGGQPARRSASVGGQRAYGVSGRRR